MTIYDTIEQATGQRPSDVSTLTGGSVGEVYRVEMPDKNTIVAKVANAPEANLAIEGYMLRFLKEHSHLPVPEVLYDSDKLLLITFLPGSNEYSQAAQVHAAELLAELHTTVTAPQFGLDRDTLSGLLPLPNRWNPSWLDFFREQRLLYVARDGVERGVIPASYLARVEKLAARLDEWVEEPERPSLIHGDVWRTNILAVDGKITALLDPAIFFAHYEIELGYMVWNRAFDAGFWERYAELHPIKPGFFEVRAVIYGLYWQLVNVWHFPSKENFRDDADNSLKRLGF